MKIKDWSKFQHFKDRTPPWIKLYRDLLDDPDWHDIPGEAAKTLIMLWLIASEDKKHEGALPDTRTLAFRLRMSIASVEKHLKQLSHWLICDDIATISRRYRGDAPETETEGETERETELQPGGPQTDSAPVVSIPLIPSHGQYGVTQGQVDDWQELFPGVDVIQTLREIKAWNDANPTRRKTKAGIKSHIVKWLNKEQCKA